MSLTILLPALTSLFALVFSVLLFDQWRERRRAYQLIWAIGMLFFGIASGCEFLAASSHWSEPLYRIWYLTGAVWTAGWLGLGTAFLLGRTRFGYTFAFCLFLAGLFTLLTQRRYDYAGAGTSPSRPLECRSRPCGPCSVSATRRSGPSGPGRRTTSSTAR